MHDTISRAGADGPAASHAPTPGPSFEGTLTGGSHAASDKYLERRAWIGEYFDRTAADGWRKLTSDEKVSRVRATVREGRDRMRQTLLSFLPADLAGWRVLDAGCGTGMLAVDLALRGADVTAIDLSPTLVGYGRERAEAAGVSERIHFHAGDMLDPSFGPMDAVVAMDSVIHYDLPQIIDALAALAARTTGPIVYTVAPWTPILGPLLTIGRLFPQRDRSPRIVPIAERRLRGAIAAAPSLAGWRSGRTQRIERGFYRSQAYELLPAGAPAASAAHTGVQA
jgi:magnesium-protoporphyrin O-methyltransferase